MRPPMVLPTTVIGSYSVDDWLGRLKDDFHQRRISAQHLAEVHDVAIKAAITDQERAGVDIVSDGELRRDNDVDYLLARMPGLEIDSTPKQSYFDYLDVTAHHRLPEPGSLPLGLVDDYRFAVDQTDRPIKFSFTGPFSLSCRIADTGSLDRAALVRDLASALNREASRLAEAGASIMQIDEPFLAGHPAAVELAMEAVNIVTGDVDVDWSLHVCYGNRYARPSWEGHYDFLFPAVLDTRIDELVLEFARKGYDDLELFRRYDWDRRVGLGVIDVKSHTTETASEIAARVRHAIEIVEPHRLTVNPDCGLRHVPSSIARAKLAAMVEGTEQVRREVSASDGEPPAADGGGDGENDAHPETS